MSSLWWIVNVISTFVELFIFDDFLEKFVANKKSKPLIHFFLYGGSVGALVLVNSVQSPLLDIVGALFVYSFFLYIAYQGMGFSRLLTVIFFLFSVACIEYLVRAVCFLIFDKITSIGFVAINIVCLLSVVLLEKLLLVISYKNISWQYRRWFAAFLILPISCLIWLLLMISGHDFMEYRMSNDWISVLFCYILLISNLLCFYFLEQLIKTADENQKKQAFIQKQKMEQTYYTAIQEKAEQQTRLLHDIKHHIQVLGQMAADGNNDRIVAYCKSVMDIYTIPVTIEYTDNNIINIILSEKAEICRKKQIDFKVNVAVVQLDHIDPAAVCLLFGNLLDNAIEGAEKFSEHKFITVQIEKFNEQFVVLSIKNSCQTAMLKKHGLFLTTKPDKDKHGYGLKSVQKIVEEQGGTVEFDCSANVFKTTVLLHIPASV